MPCVFCKDLVFTQAVAIIHRDKSLKSILSAHKKCVNKLFGAESFFHIAKIGNSHCYNCSEPCTDNSIAFAESDENIPYVVRIHKECLISLGGKKTLDLLTDLK